MTKEKSLEEHNKTQYDIHTDVEYWRSHNEFHQSDAVFNNKEIRLKDLLDKYSDVRDIAVDIGSGAGWLPARLSSYFKKVISIEPSDKAVSVSRKLYSSISNIEWIVGFAEDYLKDMLKDVKEPVLFTTCSVFQHIDDEIVSQTLTIINDKAPIHSILGFQELWGSETNQDMHHIRTKEWWKARLSKWDLDFHGPLVLSNAYKGLHGIKVSCD